MSNDHPQDGTDWTCPAYGAELVELGAVCFFSAIPHRRNCPTEQVCAAMLDQERRDLFGRIQELAAAGDVTGQYLASIITGPGQLLGGPEGIEEEAPAPELLDPLPPRVPPLPFHNDDSRGWASGSTS